MAVEAKYYGDNFKRHIHGSAKDSIKRLGYEVERLAKLNITESVYNRPQRGRYIRTGAARASIHTIYLESEIACLVGSDEESLRKTAMTRYSEISHFKRQGKTTQRKLSQLASTATGGTVFYFGWLEDGFHTRKGEFIEGHHMLKNALDRVKAGLR